MLVRLAICVVFIGIAGRQSLAWEADVHYGLTRWLAEVSGLRPEIAEQIAAGNLAADHGSYLPATFVVPVHVWLLNDETASESVQKHHFPGYGPVPGDAAKRAVEQNSVRARDWLTKEMGANVRSENQETALKDLGLALHSLQDSWSHEGVPDIPGDCFGVGFRPQLSWAHPRARGGWAVHDADQTYRWVSDPTNRPIDMARRTYEELRRFGDANQNLRQRPPADWTTLQPDVERLLAASTKDAKRDWFDKSQRVAFNTFRHQRFFNELNLPDHTLTQKALLAVQRVPEVTCRAKGMAQAGYERIRGAVSGAIRGAAERFLDALNNHNIDGAMEFVDVGAVAEQLAGEAGDGKIDANEWARRFLSMWLIDDHGMINAAGHGMPRAAGYPLLPVHPSKSTIGAAHPVGAPWFEEIEALGIGQPYAINEIKWNAPGRFYLMSFNFRRIPHDTIVLIAREQGASLRFVRMSWLTH